MAEIAKNKGRQNVVLENKNKAKEHELKNSSPKRLSCSYDLQRLIKLLQGDKIEEVSGGESGVIIIGVTGAGKTTMMHYMVGNELVMRENEDDFKFRFCLKSEDDIDSKQETVADGGIGHTLASKTFRPNVCSLNDKKMKIFDLPGFFENRDQERAIATSSFIREVIKRNSGKIRVMVVFNYHDLHANRAKTFLEANDLLTKLFKDVREIQKSVLFIFNQTPKLFSSSDRVVKFLNKTASELCSKENKPHWLSNVKMIKDIKIKLSREQLEEKKNREEKEEQESYLRNLEEQHGIISFIAQSNIVTVNSEDDLLKPDKREEILKILEGLENLKDTAFNLNKYDAKLVKFEDELRKLALQGLSVLNQKKILLNRKKEHEAILSRMESDILFYERELKESDFNDNKKNDVLVNEINARKEKFDAIKKGISEAEAKLNGIKGKMKEEDKKIKKLNSNAYKSVEVDECIKEKNYFLWIPWGYVKHKLTYQADYSFENGKPKPFDSVTVRTTKGHLVPDYNLSSKTIKKDEGICSIFYRSDWGKDANAVLKINFKQSVYHAEEIKYYERNKPLLKKSIEDFEATLLTLKKQEASVGQEIQELESNNKNKFEMIKKTNEKSALFIKKKLKELKENLQAIEQAIEEKENYLKTNYLLFQSIEQLHQLIHFENRTIFEFSKAYSSQYSIQKMDDSQEEKDKTAFSKCPITKQVLMEPVISIRCGHTFEKSAILKKINQGYGEAECGVVFFDEEKKENNVCKQKITKGDLINNFALKESLEYIQSQAKPEKKLIDNISNLSFDALKEEQKNAQNKIRELQEDAFEEKIRLGLINEELEKLVLNRNKDEKQQEEQDEESSHSHSLMPKPETEPGAARSATNKNTQYDESSSFSEDNQSFSPIPLSDFEGGGENDYEKIVPEENNNNNGNDKVVPNLGNQHH